MKIEGVNHINLFDAIKKTNDSNYSTFVNNVDLEIDNIVKEIRSRKNKVVKRLPLSKAGITVSAAISFTAMLSAIIFAVANGYDKAEIIALDRYENFYNDIMEGLIKR